MSASEWHVRGEYFETCNCDFLCPCIYTNMTAEPTHHTCKVIMTMRIDDGHFGDVKLDGITFVIAAMVDGPMADGDWTVGLIVDSAADDAQVEAIGQICSGEVGGPMEAMSALVGSFAGIERAEIKISHSAKGFAVSAGELMEHAAEAQPSAANPEVPIYLENTAHPANARLALAIGTRSRVTAFGIDWDDPKAGHNGHFAPFDWRPA